MWQPPLSVRQTTMAVTSSTGSAGILTQLLAAVAEMILFEAAQMMCWSKVRVEAIPAALKLAAVNCPAAIGSQHRRDEILRGLAAKPFPSLVLLVGSRAEDLFAHLIPRVWTE